SLGDVGGAVDDQVLVQAHCVALAGFDGQRDAAVGADIAHLAVLGKVACHDLIAVETDPDDAHLRAAVAVQGHQVRHGWGLQHRSGTVGKGRKDPKLAGEDHRRLSPLPSRRGRLGAREPAGGGDRQTGKWTGDAMDPPMIPGPPVPALAVLPGAAVLASVPPMAICGRSRAALRVPVPALAADRLTAIARPAAAGNDGPHSERMTAGATASCATPAPL